MYSAVLYRFVYWFVLYSKYITITITDVNKDGHGAQMDRQGVREFCTEFFMTKTW